MSYGLVWTAFAGGFWFVRREGERSKSLERRLWNGRIDKMLVPPFSLVMRLAERRDVPSALLLSVLVVLINAPMVVAEFALGLLIIGPIALAAQGFMVGALIAQADKRTQLFSAVVLVFELGAFASASGLGLHVAAELLLHGVPIGESVTRLFASDYLLIPVVLLLVNGVLEGCGGLLGVEGVPGVTAVRERHYKD